MPYRRGYRRRYRRRRYMRRKRTLRKTVHEVKKLKRAVEVKQYEVSAGANPTILSSNSPQSYQLTAGMQQGDGSEQRVGLKIFIKSLTLRFILKSASSNPGWMRIMLVRQKDNFNTTIPVFGDIYETVDSQSTPVTHNPVCAPKDLLTTRGFQTIYDRIIPIGGFSNTADQRFGSGETVKAIQKSFRINKELRQLSTVTAVGRIFLIVVSADSLGLQNYTFSSNIYYTDS